MTNVFIIDIIVSSVSEVSSTAVTFYLFLFFIYIFYHHHSNLTLHPFLPPSLSHIVSSGFSAPCVCVSGVVSEGSSGTHTNPQVTNHWLKPSPPTNTLAPHLFLPPDPHCPLANLPFPCSLTTSLPLSFLFPSPPPSGMPFTPLAIHLAPVIPRRAVIHPMFALQCFVGLGFFLLWTIVIIFVHVFYCPFSLCLCELTWKLPCCAFFFYYYYYFLIRMILFQISDRVQYVGFFNVFFYYFFYSTWSLW